MDYWGVASIWLTSASTSMGNMLNLSELFQYEDDVNHSKAFAVKLEWHSLESIPPPRPNNHLSMRIYDPWSYLHLITPAERSSTLTTLKKVRKKKIQIHQNVTGFLSPSANFHENRFITFQVILHISKQTNKPANMCENNEGARKHIDSVMNHDSWQTIHESSHRWRIDTLINQRCIFICYAV